MTYLTNYTAHPNPSHLPAAPKPVPTMTWAEMARAEGHRPKLPSTPSEQTKSRACGRGKRFTADQKDRMVLEAIRAEQLNAGQICAKLDLAKFSVKECITRLRKAGHKIANRSEGNRHWFEIEEQSQ